MRWCNASRWLGLGRTHCRTRCDPGQPGRCGLPRPRKRPPRIRRYRDRRLRPSSRRSLARTKRPAANRGPFWLSPISSNFRFSCAVPSAWAQTAAQALDGTAVQRAGLEPGVPAVAAWSQGLGATEVDIAVREPVATAADIAVKEPGATAAVAWSREPDATAVDIAVKVPDATGAVA